MEARRTTILPARLGRQLEDEHASVSIHWEGRCDCVDCRAAKCAVPQPFTGYVSGRHAHWTEAYDCFLECRDPDPDVLEITEPDVRRVPEEQGGRLRVMASGSADLSALSFRRPRPGRHIRAQPMRGQCLCCGALKMAADKYCADCGHLVITLGRGGKHAATAAAKLRAKASESNPAFLPVIDQIAQSGGKC
jgi:hypothetical protein